MPGSSVLCPRDGQLPMLPWAIVASPEVGSLYVDVVIGEGITGESFIDCGKIQRLRVGLDDGVVATIGDRCELETHAFASALVAGAGGLESYYLCAVDPERDVEVHVVPGQIYAPEPDDPDRGWERSEGPMIFVLRHATGAIVARHRVHLATSQYAGDGACQDHLVVLPPELRRDEACCDLPAGCALMCGRATCTSACTRAGAPEALGALSDGICHVQPAP